MATKKAKRQAALAKHEKFMADLKADGLARLKVIQSRRNEKKIHDTEHDKYSDDHCYWCKTPKEN